MAGFLSGTGVCTYAGVEFPNQISASVSVQPIPDTSGRTRKYSIHRLRIEGVFHNAMHASGSQPFGPGETLDNGMMELINKLGQPHRTLVFTGKGMGNNYSINTNHQDVAYGPVPKIIDIQFIGSNQAVRVVWEVEVHIADCLENGASQARSPYGRLLEFNYEMSWDIDESGLTYRTITGQLEIPSRRLDELSRNIRDTADKYRHLIQFDVPVGYERRQSYSLSLDKRWLRFSIMDREIPSDNPYAPGIIRPSCNYDVNSTSQGFRMWQCTLSGRFEVAQGHPRWFAWFAFLLIANSKMRAISFAAMDEGRAPQVIPLAFGFNEEVFGRATSFTLTWSLSTTWATLLKGTGLWAPVQGTTWEGWKTSMTSVGLNWSNRGVDQLRHHESQDRIIDVCEVPTSQSQNQPVIKATKSLEYPLFSRSCPKPNESWLAFQVRVTESHDTNASAHQPISKPEAYANVDNQTPSTDNHYNPGGDTREPIVQRRSDGKYYVRFRGYAIRAGYRIPRFELTHYGKSPLKKIGQGKYTHGEVGQFLCPVHLGTWDVEYVCLKTPKDNTYNIEAKKFQ